MHVRHLLKALTQDYDIVDIDENNLKIFLVLSLSLVAL